MSNCTFQLHHGNCIHAYTLCNCIVYYKWSNIIEKFTNAKRAHDNCSLKKSYMSIYGRSPLEIQMNFYAVHPQRSSDFKNLFILKTWPFWPISFSRRHDVLNSFMTLVLHHKDLNVPHSVPVHTIRYPKEIMKME